MINKKQIANLFSHANPKRLYRHLAKRTLSLKIIYGVLKKLYKLKSKNCRIRPKFRRNYIKFCDKKFIGCRFDIKFHTICKESESNPKGWQQTFSIYLRDYNPNTIEAIMDTPLIDLENMGIYCSCPSFLYNGSAYLSTKNQYNLEEYRNTKAPTTGMPFKTGFDKREAFLCKHCVLVYQYMDKRALTLRKILKQSNITDTQFKNRLKNQASQRGMQI